jgi:hypothetical protein
MLCLFDNAVRHQPDNGSERAQRDSDKLQWPSEKSRGIAQRPPQEDHQHDRCEPQHGRVEEPFLRRLRHSDHQCLGTVIRRFVVLPFAFQCRPFPVMALENTRVDAGNREVIRLPAKATLLVGARRLVNIAFPRLDVNCQECYPAFLQRFTFACDKRLIVGGGEAGSQAR